MYPMGMEGKQNVIRRKFNENQSTLCWAGIENLFLSGKFERFGGGWFLRGRETGREWVFINDVWLFVDLCGFEDSILKLDKFVKQG